MCRDHGSGGLTAMDDFPKILCYAITHAGEGERGESVEIQDRNLLPEQCTERAARHFDDEEMWQGRWELLAVGGFDVGAFDGTSRIVEVVGCPFHPEPIRFRVRYEVVRKYEAEKIEP